MKIVVNKCYGGFSISDAAVHRWAELKGLKLYPEEGQFGFVTYWTLPASERPEDLANSDVWNSMSMDERMAYNTLHDKTTLSTRPEDRADPHLVRVVEELGAEANGQFANLEITEIPDDVDWEIAEYDGREWVAEKHRTW